MIVGSLAERLAWIFGWCCAEACDRLDPKCIVLDYEDLTLDRIRFVAQCFGLIVLTENEQRLRDTVVANAKKPGEQFKSDSRRKRATAGSAITRSIEQWAMGPYRELRRRGTNWQR